MTFDGTSRRHRKKLTDGRRQIAEISKDEGGGWEGG